MVKTIVSGIFMSLLIFLFSAATVRPVTIFLVGDSTCANKTAKARPETGWGEKLGDFFTDKVRIANHAVNGRSTKSFRSEGRWDEMAAQVRKGDFIFIQFGHNDQKLEDPKRGTTPDEYAENLRRYVEEAWDLGANPVILTSVVRRRFDSDGKLIPSLGEYPAAARRVAKEMNVPLIDMEQKTARLVQEYGEEESKKLYMYVSREDYPNLEKDKKDGTHTCELGAVKFAGLVAEGIRELELRPLILYLK